MGGILILGAVALFAGTAGTRADAADDPTSGLTPAWTAAGKFEGIGADRSGRMIYAVDQRGRCSVLAPLDGKVVRSFDTPDIQSRCRTIRVARLGGDRLALVAFSTWTQGVVVSGTDGSKLWAEDNNSGVDDIAVADLDGDGRDEVIIGYNGGDLFVYDSDGKRRWRQNASGSVWHVSAADLYGDGRPEVANCEGNGDIRIRSARDGSPVARVTLGMGFTSVVGMIPGAARPPDKGDLLLADGAEDRRGLLMALSRDGKPVWKTTIGMGVDSLAPSPDGKFVVAGGRDGRIVVVRAEDGRVVAKRPGAQRFPASFTWAMADRPEGSEPLLLVANRSDVHAYHVRGEPAPAPK